MALTLSKKSSKPAIITIIWKLATETELEAISIRRDGHYRVSFRPGDKTFNRSYDTYQQYRDRKIPRVRRFSDDFNKE